MSALTALKHVARFEYGDALAQEARTEGEVPVYGSNGITGTHNAANTFGPAIIVGRKGSFGKVTWTDVPSFCIDTAYFIDSRSTKASLRWLYWSLQTLGLDEHSEDTGVPGLSREKAYQAKLKLPPSVEQERISNFLDEKTARIDALIAEKERLVEKLEEHWASVISTELGANETEGKHAWTTIPLKYVTVARCDGPFGSALTSAHYVDEGARVIRLQNIRFGEFDSTDAAFIDDDYFARELTYHSVLEGDILIAGLGDEKNFVGRACVAPNLGSNALVKADCFRFRVDTKRVLPKFVALQLSATAQRDGGLLSSGSTRQRIPLTVTECRLLCLPALAEQIDIVERLERRKREHSTLLHHTAEHIARLREYRSSLVSAAVTGQLNVDAFEARQVEAA
ncbi:putative Type I Restriction modification protein [Thiomonas arsenitoxydans]|uniref:Type I Restriction modification protein n=1 Tax=Thiomonas arsenitoxydans (strain DSM 22701 / CIP 110005 / 3As) TaxID=426114 RepID=D6CPS0_THIA3|nr:restriction endonuclease subunit S [Thiomonas arsenitoxydans]CAZ88000.1 putative Type I Restriction modification protein [Thiomonas arsenitoxydans]CQR27110.1 putative Type I Restriction modification protein [Thiomonas arsenitoxydans]CQR31662.1 putative Type I Restriction modification protein [Thiomonas arsenitoxydans]CQR31675.1 putative Type I Restriction modification protein [Thiomonas arsenitoxydans]CQR34803.1 putative Type I Restriction modification protein [Thiomonas arsenitoxydans]